MPGQTTEEIVMTAQLASYAMYARYAHPGWGYGAWASGPGWWLIFPILFWTLVLSVVGYLIYRRSPRQQARSAAERTLAERYARGEISEEELRQRRSVIRTR
jgi:putative membrane protein